MATDFRFPTDSPQTLTGLFANSVARFPDRTAVSDGEQSLTYAELDRRAATLAARLRALGLSREDRVGCYLDRSVDVVVTALGTLMAGCAYVAVDPRYPDVRRDLMFATSGAAVVVTRPQWRERLSHLPVRLLPYRSSPVNDRPATAMSPSPSTAASVIFTSGSSGTPKAIVLEHRNLAFFSVNPGLPALSPADRVGQISNISFDAFHFEVWNTLAAGAEVVFLPPVPDLIAADLRRELKRRRITALLVPTMVFNHVVREDRDAFSALRILHTGGDVARPAACRELLAGTFGGEFYNLYGPAEATTACTAQRVTGCDDADATVPIGHPLPGVTIRLLGPDDRLVARGTVGEIHVGGPGVARGYLDAPALTGERFVPDPLDPAARLYRTGDLARERDDGALEFVGRADDQVKVRGYRVEPAEVERTLRRHPRIHDAAVLPSADGMDRHLVAFVVHDGTLSLSEMRTFTEDELPDFLVPSQFISLSEIPATDHGKRDVSALREMLETHGLQRDRTAPATATERQLVDLWSGLLGMEGIGTNDDFFTLGGHSLLAVRMRGRIKREFGVDLDHRVILAAPTVAGIAAAIDESREETVV
ncbi:non-ribosomal peptide synthetase [Micromonospora echinospora]|uniref:non-ribosomal peptide synthetase n=1 Tax=Micromonospora echinospora TaxID=1877 RepID=UPI003A8671DC